MDTPRNGQYDRRSCRIQILVCWILDDREEETETCLILTAVGAANGPPTD
jgi:hypothetical protein